MGWLTKRLAITYHLSPTIHLSLRKHMVYCRRRSLLFGLLFFCAFPSGARAIDIATPVKYTALLMAVEMAAIEIFDISDNSLRYSNFENVLDDPAPQRDDDGVLLNVILHPLMGSETYLRAREGDFGVAGSVIFSMSASITWEYLVESWIEHPSTQDLVLTTGIGWMIGEIRYQIKQANNRSGRSNFWVDPIWTTLEHLDFGLTKNRHEVVPTVGLTFAL